MNEAIGFISSGYFIPQNLESNAKLEAELGLESGWIVRRTGILNRPIASPEMAVSDLAREAGLMALKKVGSLCKSGPGLLILATSTPDYLVPPTAPLVAYQLGLDQIGAFDLMGACSGFLYALAMAEAHCRVRGGWAMVIGANILSRRTDREDPRTISLFADGAGAILIGVGGKGRLVGQYLGSNGARSNDFNVPEGGSRSPYDAGTFERKGHLMKMDGKGFFRQAVRDMAQAGSLALKDAGIKPEELDLWIPHQAGERLIRESGRMMGIDTARTLETYPEWGNTSAATIAQALALGFEKERLQSGMRVLLTAVGAGMLSAGQAWEL